MCESSGMMLIKSPLAVWSSRWILCSTFLVDTLGIVIPNGDAFVEITCVKFAMAHLLPLGLFVRLIVFLSLPWVFR